MKPRAVLLISANFPPILGGSSMVYENLARYSDNRMIVVAPRRSYVDGLPLIAWREHDRLAPYRVVRLDLVRSLLLGHELSVVGKIHQIAADLMVRIKLLAQLVRLYLQEKPAAICVGELIANGWLVILLSLLGIGHRVVYVHGEEITCDAFSPANHRRARRALMAADTIVVVSRFTRDAVFDLLGSADPRVYLIANGVDNTWFKPAAKRPDLLEAYGLQDCFVFVSVCRLLEKKGIDRAIMAFAEIARSDPSCRYLIVGSGPYSNSLRQMVEAVGMSNQVIFTDQVPSEDLVDHYALGDVFVMPNRTIANGDTEGFGLVFLEANACGIPVIAGRDGGSTDAVQDGYNGLVVDGRSIEEIATAMRSLRRDGALRQRLREGGLKVAGKADWRKKADDFLRIVVD
jgi:phosphatidyl-myo-inositol dimannoside synthase